MTLLRGKYRVRYAETPQDLRAALALRALRFRGSPGEGDGDAFDTRALHVLIEDAASGRLVCCYRLLPVGKGSGIGASYSAQFYELTALADFPGPMLEMGRLCIAEGAGDADVLRVAWGVLADYVDRNGIKLLFGCSSFAGTESEAYADAFALLKDRHLAPRRWLPKVKAPSVFRFARLLKSRRPDLKAAMRAMPPLLRTYLAMGGWVSDHAVVDHDLGTLHVFTGLEIGGIPAGRARLLRTAAG